MQKPHIDASPARRSGTGLSPGKSPPHQEFIESIAAQSALSAQNFTERGFCRLTEGYPLGMSPMEQLIDEVEVSITDALDALDDEQSAQLYAEVLDVEQRLEALRDALNVLATARL